MQAEIKPFVPNGEATVPASKSLSHRYLIAAHLSGNVLLAKNVNECDDIVATCNCLGKLSLDDDFFCNESASTLRFLIPLSLVFNNKAAFTGKKILLQRGANAYANIFADKNIHFCVTENKILLDGNLTSGKYEVDGSISSQYISGLLFALPLLQGDSTITIIPPLVSKPYLNLTLQVLQKSGVEISLNNENEFFIPGGQKYMMPAVEVEGDWSNGAVLYGFNNVGGRIVIQGLNADSQQGDKICLKFYEQLQHNNAQIDLTDYPDLAPIMFVTAALLKGGTFFGTNRLQNKESNRLDDMIAEMAKFGIKTEKGNNLLKIMASKLQAPRGAVDGHNDHRVIMAMTLLLSKTGGVLTGVESVKKSWPDFFAVLQNLGMQISVRE